MNQAAPRTVIIQTGGYGEHLCLSVSVSGKSYPVDDRFFTVQLAPGAGAEMTIIAKRYANPPTLTFPWHGDNVPEP